MNNGSERPISSSTWRGIMHMNQPLKSTSIRLCSQRVERRLRAPKSQSGNTPGAESHQKRHG